LRHFSPSSAQITALLVSRDPSTNATLWQGEASDLAEQIACARAAYPQWAAQPLSVRVDAVRRLSAEIRRIHADFIDIMARETGRPVWDIVPEIDLTLARLDACVRAYAERCSQRRQESGNQGTLAVRHKPLGVLAVITPFAQPLATPMGHIGPALLAGNAVIFKPAEQGLATAALIMACARRAGLPKDLLHLAVGDAGAGQALATADGVDGTLFTGSAASGQALARKLASRPERLLSLSLGGNNPLVVWDTPQIEEAAMLVIQSAFSASGQRATCARRLILREGIAEPLLAEIKRLADRIICAAPFAEPTPFMGPVVSNEVADAMIESYLWLMEKGGRPIKHMARLSQDLPFISPAIIDVTGIAEQPDVELFGPLLQVQRVPDFDAAIAAANATRFGLVAGLIGGTQADYNRFWANVRAGQIHWNRPTTTDLAAAPLGGIGLSGNFRPGGYYTADACAYPVSSVETESLRVLIGAGFAPDF
jgi:succinylglutamic semialdehyde dehydrogenase